VLLFAADRFDGSARADAICEGRDQPLDVAQRAALHDAPLRLIADLEHPVVVQEVRDEAHRKAPKTPCRAGPERSAERHQIAVEEALGESPLLAPLLDARLFVVEREDVGGEAVEAQDVPQHVPVPEREESTLLRKEPLHAGAGILEAVLVVAHAEAHRTRLAGHA
jgi:hypothetical protein